MKRAPRCGRRDEAPPPRSQVHSPANGFFCVSTPQITMAKLEENQAAQGLRARPPGPARSPPHSQQHA